ncbi:GNAT family N-acetyltransferase [Phytoactinopolyspora alkaliphila]|uniref:GNAT family N-acetyltransferase n=1 Tax=Phytoactinopolyspora alkaliphila TaxID=1783498 RepID=A0A6N9YGP0_9ACTN|nr:GNAT family N-acetyltransferase [Phytoactinopolyspora alkaliphila]NED94124.1 GNAT family N-acetyltransferase [Phytoactinopolyspora alkaliphila]
MAQDIPGLRTARFRDLDAHTLYGLLKLRVDVFVVEQECPYPELDGRDTLPSTWHLWFPGPDHLPLAYLRMLDEPGGAARIGRVAVAPAARGTGLAGRLMDAALELVGDRSCVLDAQAYLVAFYRRYGFSPTGPEYLEDGIPHVPMARPPAPRS